MISEMMVSTLLMIWFLPIIKKYRPSTGSGTTNNILNRLLSVFAVAKK